MMDRGVKYRTKIFSIISSSKFWQNNNLKELGGWTDQQIQIPTMDNVKHANPIAICMDITD